ncbi:MAG TPA: hypothetical protein PLJ38_05145, partial [bacterium]|nr:hypothetical protein [bacterium]
MNISALQKEQILNLINYQSQRLKKQEELSKSHNRIISDLEILAGTLKLVDSDFDFFADLIK